MHNRRELLLGAAAGAAVLPFTFGPAAAQAPAVKLFVPAAPGGGWDQTARTMEQVLRANNQVASVQITNVGGAGGTVGLPQFVNQWKGQSNALMVGGMVMVGAIIANKAPIKLTQTIPIARLTGESLAVVVPAASPFKTVADLIAALKADPAKVPIAGGSAGGSDHILAGLMAKSAGVDPTKVSYVAFAGGGPATAAILGNQVAAGISGYGEFAEQIKAGKMRCLAISGDKREEGVDAPTLKEGGLDLVLFNWRGVFAPPGLSAQQVAEVTKLVEDMTKSPAWTEACKAKGWVQITMVGKAYEEFVASETTRIEGILKDLGLA
jgi:putative tricarboxylic transport membrane protein